jgi:hypothetical protein
VRNALEWAQVKALADWGAAHGAPLVSRVLSRRQSRAARHGDPGCPVPGPGRPHHHRGGSLASYVGDVIVGTEQDPTPLFLILQPRGMVSPR